jgi:pilus assembly protein CpaB
MKAARVVVLGVAVAAGGIAALLAGRSEKPPQLKQVTAPKLDSVDILVSKNDIPTGKEISPQDVQWQAWPKVHRSEKRKPVFGNGNRQDFRTGFYPV